MVVLSSDLAKYGKKYINNFSKPTYSELPALKGKEEFTDKIIKSTLVKEPEEDTFIFDVLDGKLNIPKNNSINQRPPKYTGELLKFELPKETVPPEIEQIQKGRLGIVRQQEELSAKEITTLIKHQQEAFSPEEIEKIINSFPKEDRSIVGEIFARITQFANYDSLPEIVKQIPNGITEDRLTGLGSTIRYLSKHEGAFDKKPEFVENGGRFIVDKIFMERIESDKEYLDKGTLGFYSIQKKKADGSLPTYEEVRAAYDKYYAGEKFVRVLDKGVCPETKWVEGSNYVDINFVIDERTGRIIMMGALDNLVKGAAGQAVQSRPDCRRRCAPGEARETPR